MRFPHPSTPEETGSDQRRVCLTRLSCAFRLSQPPDASFLPRPFRLCFTPVTPLGFTLQSLHPPTQSAESLDLPAPHGVVHVSRSVRPPTQGRHSATRNGIHLQGFQPRESPYCQPPGVTLTVGADPLLGFHLPGVFSPPATVVPVCTTSSHALSCRRRTKRPQQRCPRVSVSRKMGLPLSRLPTLPRSSSSSSSR
jgi:hypothetical protein